MPKGRLGQLVALGCAFGSISVHAATPIIPKFTIDRAEHQEQANTQLVLPYLFSTETMGLNVGVGGMIKGAFQEQLIMGATAYGGEESWGVAGGFWNLRIPKTERFFLSGFGFVGYYPEQQAHTSGNIPVDNNRPFPGSSGSSYDDAIVGAGYSNSAEIKLEYVLPIGHHRQSPTLHYETRGGILTNPKQQQNWNPLKTGSTIAMVRGFYHYQSYNTADLVELDGSTKGLEFGIKYDNTDFVVNPSTGSKQYLSYTHNGHILGEDWSWNSWQFDSSHYWSLGESDWARQRVLAFNFWTAYSPSWRVESVGNDASKVSDAPPYNMGASLGGWDRMRGYTSNRFHDKAAIYSSLEYRYTLDYNPTVDMSLLRLFQIDWFQVVPFVEVGEVAPEYSASELFSDMKYDVGVSLRMLAASTVLRADLATSQEGTNLWFMVGHPF